MTFSLLPYEACWFCRYLANAAPCAFIIENDLAVAIVNQRQYERGAMLVIPRQHRETILDIQDPELAARAFGAIGANVYQNNGIKAGQHVPHLHVHVVPRYKSSDPAKIFLQQDFEVTPIEQQYAIATAIRAAL